jgi:hypothetical protein
MPKGEKVLSPKQKDRTTTFKKNRNEVLIDVFSHWYLLINIHASVVKIKFKLVSNLQLTLQLVSFQYSKLESISKTLLKAKRKISFRGSFI